MTRFQELQGVSGIHRDIAWLLTRGVVRFSEKVRIKTDSRRTIEVWVTFWSRNVFPLKQSRGQDNWTKSDFRMFLQQQVELIRCDGSLTDDQISQSSFVLEFLAASCFLFFHYRIRRPKLSNKLTIDRVERRLTIHPPHFPSGLFRDRWRSLLFIISQGELSTDDEKPLQGRS